MDRIKKQIVKRSLIVVLGLTVLLSCKAQDVKSDLVSPEELIEVQKPLNEIQHMVFFALKDGRSKTDLTLFKDRLSSLAKIEEVRRIVVSESQDLGDPRALDYDVVMTILFRNKTEMDIYFEHPFHLIVKESLKPYLKGAPATLDLIPD